MPLPWLFFKYGDNFVLPVRGGQIKEIFTESISFSVFRYDFIQLKLFYNMTIVVATIVFLVVGSHSWTLPKVLCITELH